jgi:general secretion pathway protein G
MITTGDKVAVIIASVLVIPVIAVCALYMFAPPIVCRRYPRDDIRALSVQLEFYRKFNGAYPTTGEGLSALVPRVMEDVPKDPWGTPYVYRFPGKRYANGYDLFSAGPDRLEETADDDWGK